LQPEGLTKYENLNTLGELNRDLWIDYDTINTNRPLRNGAKIKFLITGGGHAGLLIAARLIQQGFSSSEIVIVEKGGGFGGTWYWNRYPGLMCDVEGYCYLPLLEETGFMPKHRYSYGSEIRANAEAIAKTFGLQGQFGAEVTGKQWNEDKHHWRVEISQNTGVDTVETLQVEAQFVFLVAGVFPTPHIPRLEGFDQMRQNVTVMHTARWDYSVTGGTQEKPDLTKLQGKVVGIVGTGATAAQVIPEVAKWAKHVYVFQRSPSYVGPRGQKETTLEDWASITSKKGWQEERSINLDENIANEDTTFDLVADGWSK
ncbi:hypothetical protein COCMIDRAFT_63297, partial [Bipolaris oryzae ATCC 44560]